MGAIEREVALWGQRWNVTSMDLALLIRQMDTIGDFERIVGRVGSSLKTNLPDAARGELADIVVRRIAQAQEGPWPPAGS